MIIFLRCPNYLLYLLCGCIFIGSQTSLAQQGDAANFSIYGDIYSGQPNLLTDDWFQGSIIDPSSGLSVPNGIGIIDETQTQKFTDDARLNNGFTTRSRFGQYENLNGFLLYDAIFGRDHVNFGSGTGGRDKSAFLGSSGKYTDNPMDDWDLGTNEIVGGSVDLVDVYAHLRRNGITVDDSMWLTLGASTFDNTGEHYVDFELYASPIELSADRTKFVNSGPDNTGGHTAWIINSDGEVTSSGDMLAGFKFYNNAVDNVELKIWVSLDTYLYIDPLRFDFVNFDPGTDNHGYATIRLLTSDVKSSGVNFAGVTGPPWGTFRNRPGDPYVKNYAFGSFAEVGINLTSLGLDPSLATGNPCDAPFTKLLVKSKSSNSLNATLKDFAGPYNFLGSSVVDTQIKPMNPRYFVCGQTEYNLSPLNPQDGSYYIWSTEDGLFDNGTPEGAKSMVGQDVVALTPGTYRLAAAPLEGCTESFDTITIYAEPCANPDSAEVIENGGPVVIQVLNNDTDPDTDLKTDGSIKNASFKAPDNGTLVVDKINNTISYTPNPHFYGVDTFEYQVCDNTPQQAPHNGNYCNVTLVTVNVLRDTDNDKVADRDDLDDDNDGIPDSIELQCAPITTMNLVMDADFEEVNILSSGLDESDNDATNRGSVGIWKGDASFIPNWESADLVDNHLEIWRNGYDNSGNIDGGTGSFSGEQFVEVSASSNDGLYQDISTTPGDILYWSFAHRNRASTDDVIEVLIGDPTSPLISQGTYTSAPDFVWKLNDGFYKVPPGQTTTRIRFRSVIGSNFIDLVTARVFDPCYDFDADGIPNYLDLDSDNDAIPDVLEAGLTDANNDGYVDTGSYGRNGLADDVETFAESGIINYTILNTDANSDIDPGFTLYNFMDVDSDNDGITDTWEAFFDNPKYNDDNYDGRIDGFIDLPVNMDRNGWHDPIDDEINFPTPLNSDVDTIPDYLDLDSDGDGIPDTLESNYAVGDSDNNGIVGTGIPLDEDKDGLANTNDPHFPDNFLSGKYLEDLDGDGLPNHLDIDADNDGILDIIEAQSTFNYYPPSGNDSNGNGLEDKFDVGGVAQGIGYINTDGGSIPDFLDTNSDNDPLFDISENRLSDSVDAALDTDDDGMVDGTATDSDGDGLADIFDNIDKNDPDPNIRSKNVTNDEQTAYYHPDTDPVGNDRDWREFSDSDNDHDGILDAADLDDDNDGILDIVEGGGDNDNDGVVAYLDIDDNDNTKFEVLELTDANKLYDLDGDGIPNQFDLDSDGDGIPDYNEAGGLEDEDGSGNPETGLLNSSQVGDQTGIDYGVPLKAIFPTTTSPQVGLNPMDTDNDGIPDYFDLDSDNDGITDVLEAGGVDGNKIGEYGAGNTNDIDADGLADALDVIYNNDVADPSDPSVILYSKGSVMGGTPLTAANTSGKFVVRNSDNDLLPDYLDLDSDDDTIPDNIEAQPTLEYEDYSILDLDGDGIRDTYDQDYGIYLIPVDTDSDGTPDYLDLDSDNDIYLPDGSLNPNGGYDIVEAHFSPIPHNSGRTTGTVGGNGLDDAFENASNVDLYIEPRGNLDASQANNFPDSDQDVYKGGDVDWRDDTYSDFDGDNIPDSIDLDDDNDGILDTLESSLGYAPGNSRDPDDDDDNDGIPNYRDPDFCPGSFQNGICTDFDADGDGWPNHLDLDSDDDGCSDAVEGGATLEIASNYQFPVTPVGTDGIPDAVQSSTGPDSGLVDSNIETISENLNFLDVSNANACYADLSLSNSVNKTTPNIGETVTFTLTLTNSGPFPVTGVQVLNKLPAGLLYISGNTTSGSYDPATGIWNLQGLTLDPTGAGNGWTLEITATVGPDCKSIDTIAEIYSSDRYDLDSTPNNGE